MRETQGLVPNALLAVPDPNVAIMQKCTVFPVEFVVRGFMTGECHLLREPSPAQAAINLRLLFLQDV